MDQPRCAAGKAATTPGPWPCARPCAGPTQPPPLLSGPRFYSGKNNTLPDEQLVWAISGAQPRARRRGGGEGCSHPPTPGVGVASGKGSPYKRAVGGPVAPPPPPRPPPGAPPKSTPKTHLQAHPQPILPLSGTRTPCRRRPPRRRTGRCCTRNCSRDGVCVCVCVCVPCASGLQCPVASGGPIVRPLLRYVGRRPRVKGGTPAWQSPRAVVLLSAAPR